MHTPLWALFFFLVPLTHAQLYTDPDLPFFFPPQETISECSLIIAMDHYLYASELGLSFDTKAYGFVNQLLWHDVPVKWIIRTGKSQNGYDIFNASVQRYWPNPSSTNKTVSFAGGPFVVDVTFTRYIQVFAPTWLKTVGLNVLIYKLLKGIEAPVRYNLDRRPYVAVLDSSGQNTIQVAYLQDAGFVMGQHFTIMSYAQANNLSDDACVTICTEPHFHALDRTNYPTSFVNGARQFVESGGNFLAECGGISTYEQCDCQSVNANSSTSDRNEQLNPSICKPGYFVTDGSLNIGNIKVTLDQTSLIKSVFPELPISQWTGVWRVQGGSVNFMSLWNSALDGSSNMFHNGSKFVNSTFSRKNRGYAAVWHPESNRSSTRRRDSLTSDYEYDPTGVLLDGPMFNGYYYVTGAKLQQFQNKLGGNVFYLAGHQYANTDAGVRIYLNALFIPANRSTNCKVNVQVTQCTNYSDLTTCKIVNVSKGFQIDVITPVKKRSELQTANDTTIPTVSSFPIPCNCQQFLDVCGVCGGNNNSCAPTVNVSDGVTSSFTGGRPLTVPPGYNFNQSRVITGALPSTPSPLPTTTGGGLPPQLSPFEVISLIAVAPPNQFPQVGSISVDLSKVSATLTLDPPATDIADAYNLQDLLRSFISGSYQIPLSSVYAIIPGPDYDKAYITIGTPYPFDNNTATSGAYGPETDITNKPVLVDQLIGQGAMKIYKFVAGTNIANFRLYVDVLSTDAGDTAVILQVRKLEIPLDGVDDCNQTISQELTGYIFDYKLKKSVGCPSLPDLDGGEWFVKIEAISGNPSISVSVFLEEKPATFNLPTPHIPSTAGIYNCSFLLFLIFSFLVAFL